MKKEIKKTIIVGLSGGIDSAISAGILKKQGYDVIGVTIKMGNKKTAKLGENTCFGLSEKDNFSLAKKIAKILGIKHYIFDLSSEFEKYVLKYFQKEYLAGRTPNPCVICNQKIKFGYLFDKIINSGIKFDYFATGHYAQIKYDNQKKRYLLLQGKDQTKDQSYFLYRLSQSQLKKIKFPLGEYTKKQVKKMAKNFGLQELLQKKESQDFVRDGNYGKIIGKKGLKPGKIIDFEGKIIGNHQGLINFTVGQRKGLNIGGLKEPYYVASLNSKRNEVRAGKKEQIFSQEFEIKNSKWISFQKLEKPIKAKVKIRSGSNFFDCEIKPLKKTFKIKLFQPAFAVAAGQSAVFYQKNEVLGGGIIQK